MGTAWIGWVAVGILAGSAPNALAAVSQVQAAPHEAAQGDATVVSCSGFRTIPEQAT